MPEGGQRARRHRAGQRALQLRRRSHGRREFTHFLRRLVLLSALLTLLNLASAAAFAIFEHESYWQGLIRTLDIVATIGSISHPSDLGSQITEVVLITLGLGTLFYLLVTVSELFVAGELTGFMEARRMQRKIADLRDHYLICGYGRVGRQVARDLDEAAVPFVVIDNNPDTIEDLEETEHLWLDGRGSDDEVMQ